MSHYFINDPALRHDPAQFELDFDGARFAFETDAGVFSREHLDDGSALLIRTVPPLTGRAVDLGCGWGPIGILLAHRNPDCAFTLVDVNERAVDLARRNIQKNGLTNAQAFVSDGLSGVDGPLDAVISNPPVRIGKQAMYGLFSQAHDKLRPGGLLCIVLRKQQGAPSCKKFLTQLFGSCETAARGGGFHILVCVKTSAAADGSANIQ